MKMYNNNFLVTRGFEKLPLKPQKPLHFEILRNSFRNKIYFAAINFSKHFRLDLHSVSSNQIIDFFFRKNYCSDKHFKLRNNIYT